MRPSPCWRIVPGTTFPVSSYGPPPPAASTWDGVLAAVAVPKLVTSRAPASRRAAASATTSRILRLREGSIAAAIIAGGRGCLLRCPAPGALARMALARPRREQQHEARVLLGGHLVALVRLEVRGEACAARLRAVAGRQFDLAVGHEQVGALVNLVVLELL